MVYLHNICINMGDLLPSEEIADNTDDDEYETVYN